MGCDHGIGLFAKYLNDRTSDDALLAQTEPLGVGAIGEAVTAAGIDMGDHRRNGVEDEAQSAFGKPQGAGDLVDLAIGLFEFSRAFAHARFELRVVLLDHRLGAALLGDVSP